jgi:hypothetical protein
VFVSAVAAMKVSRKQHADRGSDVPLLGDSNWQPRQFLVARGGNYRSCQLSPRNMTVRLPVGAAVPSSVTPQLSAGNET